MIDFKIISYQLRLRLKAIPPIAAAPEAIIANTDTARLFLSPVAGDFFRSLSEASTTEGDFCPV